MSIRISLRILTAIAAVFFATAATRHEAAPLPIKKQVLLPDLTIDDARLLASVVFRTRTFKSTDCAVQEGCVNGAGKRTLMRFDVATPNIGDADLVLGSPINNPLFVYSQCHGHYHFSGYAKYELLNSSGSIVLTGRKQAFCLEDFERFDPNAGPAKFTCSNQGISVGWQDTYGSYLDCQWLDITGIPPGNYRLQVTINPEGILTESDYNNNMVNVPVTIRK
jgi:hypothetical protein